jgi:hypothetical protein
MVHLSAFSFFNTFNLRSFHSLAIAHGTRYFPPLAHTKNNPNKIDRTFARIKPYSNNTHSSDLHSSSFMKTQWALQTINCKPDHEFY